MLYKTRMGYEISLYYPDLIFSAVALATISNKQAIFKNCKIVQRFLKRLKDKSDFNV